jgi:hypothetical protein
LFYHPSILNFEGPKAGCQLIGPIDENRTSIHACYSDFIIAGFMKGRMMPLPGSEQSLEDSVDEWKRQYPHSCRTTCPENRASSLIAEDTVLASVSTVLSPTPSPVIPSGTLPGLRRSIRLTNINSILHHGFPVSRFFIPMLSTGSITIWHSISTTFYVFLGLFDLGGVFRLSG